MTFMFKLEYDNGRPVVTSILKNAKIKMLIDTGANMPMFAGTFDALKEFYPDAVMLDETVLIGGINSADEYRVANIPELYVGKLKFVYLKVAIWNKSRYDYDFLLSATMFEFVNLSIHFTEDLLLIESDRDEFGSILIDEGKQTGDFVHKRLKILVQ